MANSWWERQNEGIDASNNAPINSGIWGYSGPRTVTPRVDAPSDWDAFRENFGGGNASEGEYKNWAIGQQRERTMGDFVNRMASQDPTAAANTSRIQGDLANYGGRMDQFLDTAAPTRVANAFGEAPVMSQDNRFEAGLAANEKRLSALQDDPNSIQQTAAYKFRVGQGQEALQRQMAAKGMLGSGNRLMELTKYGQDMGSQEYEAQANRLIGLVGQYGNQWLGDKNANTQQYTSKSNAWIGADNANTQRYTAENNAWDQRGGLLKDLVGQANTSANQNQQISGNDRNAWANTWVNANNKPMQYAQAIAGGPSIKWG